VVRRGDINVVHQGICRRRKSRVMGNRREVRLCLCLPVRICGVDAQGEAFEQNVATVDITATGVHLQDVKCALERGRIVSIQYRGSKANFKVTWVKNPGTPLHGHIGLKLMERETMNWGRAIPRIPGDAFVKQVDSDDCDIKFLH